MAHGVTPDGINPNSRVHPTTERKLYAKVVDSILDSTTYAARSLGTGGVFRGKTYDIPMKVSDSGLGEWFSGLENLSTSASDTLIELSYAQAAFAQPVVSVMLESFANSGPEGTIDLDLFKLDEAAAEAISAVGARFYDGVSASKQILGLESHVDDGTTAATIGGQTRATYDALDGTVTASGGTLTLAKLATLQSAINAAGLASEGSTLNLTTKTVWDLYERLLQPNVRADYNSSGGPALGLRDRTLSRSEAALKGMAGFTALSWRGIPVIADDAATSGVWYMLNERYLMWKGRTSVPSKYAGQLTKVSLGSKGVIEGVGAQRPPSAAGWFFQKMQMMPNQAGMVGRIYLIGQQVGSQPRRQGKLTGVTGV